MNEIVWDSRIAARLLPPSEADAWHIDMLAQSNAHKQEFRDRIFALAHDAHKDIDQAPAMIAGLFGAHNEYVERYLSEVSEKYEPWSLASLQPKVLARSLPALPKMTSSLNEVFDELPQGGSRNLINEILKSIFWQETSTVQNSELIPVTSDLYKIILSNEFQEFFRSDYYRRLGMNASFGISVGLIASTFLGPVGGIAAGVAGFIKWQQNRRQTKFGIPYAHNASLRSYRSVDAKGEWTHHIIFISPEQESDSINLRAAITTEEINERFTSLCYASAGLIIDYQRYQHREKVPSIIRDFKENYNSGKTFVDQSNIKLEKSLDTDVDFGYIVERLKGDITEFSEDVDKDLRKMLNQVDEFAAKNPGQRVSPLILRLFPQIRKKTDSGISKPTLPLIAPEKYQGLRCPETPPEFVKRVYGPWLGQGLDRAHIRHLDPVLSTAINNWLKREGNEWPTDVDLPTRKEQNDRLVKSVQTDEPTNLTLREARRLEGLIQSRRPEKNK